VEATPDPRGKFWVTPEQAAKLHERITTGDRSPDPLLVRSLEATLSPESGAREHVPE
jgi:hypothetical protein